MRDREPYSVEVVLEPRVGEGSIVFDVYLADRQRAGRAEAGVARLDFEQGSERTFLEQFLAGQVVRLSQGVAFGRELAARLFQRDERLRAEWVAIRHRRGGRPLRLELVLPRRPEVAGASALRVALDDIPFELLADEGDGGFWFRRPGWCLVRTFAGLTAKSYRLPKQGRALLAWANPERESDKGGRTKLPDEIFAAHEATFKKEVSALGLRAREPCQRATLVSFAECLRERPETPLLALVAHGDPKGGAVLLHDEDSGEGEGVSAHDFAKVCRAGGVKVVLLWSCHGARRHPMRSSVALALLDSDGGDAAAVVASQAALVAERTARFVGPLLRLLRDVAEGSLERAVTEARTGAMAEDDLQWAAPVYYARPLQGNSVTLEENVEQAIAEIAEVSAAPGLRVEGAPELRSWFRGRQGEITRTLALLRAHRLVTFTGGPGIGKTTLAAAVARQAVEDGALGWQRARWVDLSSTPSAAVLREELARAFELDPAKCTTDEALAQSVGARRALLVLDNAEDLQQQDGEGLRGLLDTLLRGATGVKALVTSRRALGDLDGVEEQMFSVGRLPKGVDREVFVAVAGERLAEEKAKHASLEADIDALVGALAGHPQSIVLVAGQVGRTMSLRELKERVEAEDTEVVRAAGLLDDEIDESQDAKLRTRRLASSLNLSFRPLVKAAPRAAEVFAWLSMFPGGLPEVLATAVFGDDAKRAVARLRALNMIERGGADDRLTLAGPVRWYAQAQQSTAIEAARRDELLGRSAAAMATWLGGLHTKLGQPGAAEAITRAIHDGPSLTALAAALRESRVDVAVVRHIAAAFAAYGRLASYGGQHREALSIGERVLSAIVSMNDASSIASLHEELGNLYVRTARLAQAEGAYEQALPLYRAIDARLGEANTLQGFGTLALAFQESTEAFRYYLGALEIQRAIRDDLGMGGTHVYLARAAHMAGYRERAAALGGRGFTILRRIEDSFGQMLAAADLVSVLAQQQDEAIVAFLAFVWAVARTIGDPCAQRYEAIVREIGVDPDTTPLDVLIEEALPRMLAAFERYEQVLRDRGEDPYSPLKPA